MTKDDNLVDEAEETTSKNIDGPEENENQPGDVFNDDGGKSINALLNVKLDVRVVLGRSRMPISDLLDLTRGSVIELDRKVGDPVDIMINDRVVAQGELVKVSGDYIGVALREIVKDFIPST
jgi:flagellar motor switch protein FliN